MNKKLLSLILALFVCVFSYAEKTEKSVLQQQAETATGGAARSLYIRAFNEYVKKGQVERGVECGVKAAAIYYRNNEYKEAFELLRNIDQSISSYRTSESGKAALRYQTTKERMSIYMRLHRSASVMDQLNIMERYAANSGDDNLKNDFLYNKAIYYYSFGMNEKGNEVFKEMSSKLIASKDYDKVDDAYKALIASARRSGSAGMIAQSYSSYVVWRDSMNAMKKADEINVLKKQISDYEAVIADKDDSLNTRQAIIIGLCILALVLVAALIAGTLILLRYIFLARKQKNIIKIAHENNALKAQFISNISGQLEPTLRRLDNELPEVKALLNFCTHIQTLSNLEKSPGETIEVEDVAIQQFCEELKERVANRLKDDVSIKVDAPKMNVPMNKEYVFHILLHLLENAAYYTPSGGNIHLDFKKRGPHKCQFLVSDTGEGVPEEKREDIFKPFLEIRDLTTGDGLGLPICKQMALKMNGDLEIDSEFTKGTRFILSLSM